MAVIQYEVSIRIMPNKYGYQSRLIKDIITHFESAQQDGIYNNQKNLAENRNKCQILRWVWDHLIFQIGHQS